MKTYIVFFVFSFVEVIVATDCCAKKVFILIAIVETFQIIFIPLFYSAISQSRVESVLCLSRQILSNIFTNFRNVSFEIIFTAFIVFSTGTGRFCLETELARSLRNNETFVP